MTTTIFNREERDSRSFSSRGFSGIPFRLIGLLLLAVVGVAIFLSIFRVTRIGAGYVGIEINLAGSQRGASEIPIRTGWLFYSPLRSQVIEYPTFVQTVKWTADTSEGHPINEELVFNSKQGQEVRADVRTSLPPADASQQTRLDDHDARPFLADQLAQLGPCRLESCEGIFARGRIVDTGHALVFAKVDSKNGFRGRGCRNRVHRASSSWGWWGLFAW